MKLTNLYRISDSSYRKDRLGDKWACLRNFLNHFDPDETIIFADNVKDETYERIHSMSKGAGVQRTHSEGNADSFNIVYNYALQHAPADSYVYFVEDDYLHREGSEKVLLEGLLRADYASLYDHPDKYLPAIKGGNPFIGADAAETTKVFVTKSCHWKLTNSTTMTFASHIDVLTEDQGVWRDHTSGKHPNDMQAFLELRKRGRSLATPLPSWSTHCDLPWLAPLIDWESVK